MKATGIVRRIDDLGRVVIPKEIRRTMRIREGDPLEIFTDGGGEVIFKKYSPIGELSEFAGDCADVLYRTGGAPVVITDRDHVLAVSGVPKKELLERRVSPALEELMERRTPFYRESDEVFCPVEGIGKEALGAFVIVADGDVCGAVITLTTDGKHKADDADKKLLSASAGFLAKQLAE